MKPAVTTMARELIERALQEGDSLDSIADLCGVNVGSVKRWFATGRASKEKIAPLAAKVGPVYPSPSAVAQHLIAIKKHLGNPKLRIKRSYIKKIAGRSRLKGAFETELIEYLDGEGYLFIEDVDPETDDDIYFMFRRSWLRKNIKTSLTRKNIEEFFEEEVEKSSRDLDRLAYEDEAEENAA